MRVLIGCEESQAVCIEFRKRGHEAYSCDILACSGGYPEWHIKDNVLDVINQGWDMGLFYPPCTRLCNSGVRWLHERNLWEEMRQSARFFKELLDANIPKKCVENSIPHKYALEIIGRKYDQILQPWQFGHPETKGTCLWLENLDPLVPTNIVEGREGRIWKMPPSKDRAKLRSKTFPGIAEAKAAQWG